MAAKKKSARKKAARKKGARKKAPAKKAPRKQGPEEREPGIYLDVPDMDYHSWHYAVSQSTLKTVRNLTPQHAYHDLLHPREQTDAMAFGEALHLAALQPDLFQERVVCGLGVTRQSNANKELWKVFEEQNRGKLILPEKQYLKLELMREAIEGHELSRSLVQMEGHREVSTVWIDPNTGVKCKSRLDLLGRWRDMNVICDVKTTDCDLSDDALMRTIGKFGYDVQAAFYLDGANVLAEADRHFYFLFVAKKPPHHIRVIELTDVALYEGKWKYEKALKTWSKCVKDNVYPGFPQVVTRLNLKSWDEVSEREFDEEGGL